MALTIIPASCTLCGACEVECPNAAIRLEKDFFVIDPDLCTECAGQFDDPQCASVCPVPGTCVPG